MNEVSAPAVEVKPAATLLLVDDRPNLEVFMMKRSENTRFAGGMWVFPGGAVDEADAGYGRCCINRAEGDANAELEVASNGLAWYVAALREAFEEAGIMFARSAASREVLTLHDESVRQRFDAHRDALNRGDIDFLQIVEQENLLLDLGEVRYVARWITPPGPPRRFDTRFFVAAMPSFQEPIHDDGELVHSAWLSPAAVMESAAAGEMGMLPPTLRMIERLAEFSSAAEVMEAAAADLPVERVPMGGKSAPAGISRAEPGWVKLKKLR